MSAKRNIEEFKIEAVKQVTDRGYKIGETCGKNRVYQVMKEAGIRSQRAHKMHRGFKSGDLSHVAPNVLDRGFGVD